MIASAVQLGSPDAILGRIALGTFGRGVVDGAIDYKAQAHSRVIAQYRNSPKLIAVINVLADYAQEIENVLLTIPMLDDPDFAEGINLDVTAEMVGQKRRLVNGDAASDPMLRTLIWAQIVRNHSHGTGPEIIAGLSLVFGGAQVRFYSHGAMVIGYAIGRTLTDDEVAVLDGEVIVRPGAVAVSPREWFDPTSFFGFDDTPGAQGFSELNDLTPMGGRFAEVF